MADQIIAWVDQGIGLLLQIAVLGGLYLLAKLRTRFKTMLDSQTTYQQRQLLAQLGREAFAYAETVYRDHDGPAKLNQATRYLLDRCETCGLEEIPVQDARALIESAWLEQNRTQYEASKMLPPASFSEEKR